MPSDYTSEGGAIRVRVMTRRVLPAGLLAAFLPEALAQEPVRVAIAGLVHGHVDGFLRAARDRAEIEIAGIQEPDAALQRKYAQRYGLSQSLFYSDIGGLLSGAKPHAVAAFSNTFDHKSIVEACARQKVHVMMEKPLAVSVEHARAIQNAAAHGGIHVIVNYETTWYRSHAALWKLVKQDNALGEIRKVVAMDGHPGPKEIGVGPEFLAWLSDPVKNGAGALFDFGCYGANLMTWLMDNARPVAVTAVTQQMKPSIYPRVDDEAAILIEYPGALSIVEASWNWPFNRKDLEVYGQKGQAIAYGGNVLRVRLPGQSADQPAALSDLPAPERDSISYLASVVRGSLKPSGLSSLENNMIVTEILSAARESASTGKRIVFQ